MSQGYGPPGADQPGPGPGPGQPGSGQPPQYGEQPPAYGQGGYGSVPAYPSAPTEPGYGQPSYGVGGPGDPPGTYMGRTLANWLQRVGAYLIDGLIGSIPWLILALPFTISSSNGSASTGLGLLASLGYLLSLGIHIYNRWIQQGQTGQSWGKRALNLRLVRMSDGQPVGPLMAFVRDICHFLDGICLIGYLFPLWDARRQTFADKIVNTVVLAEG